jgi:hypothetical protein
MYISQEPQQNVTSQQAPNKRKNKAGIIVFFINLFLMAVAFFMIKNQNESKVEKQTEANTNNTALPVEIIPAAENPSESSTSEAQNLVEIKTSDNSSSEANIVANTVPNNVGISITAPPKQTTTVSNSNSSSNTTKKSTKTRTS